MQSIPEHTSVKIINDKWREQPQIMLGYNFCLWLKKEESENKAYGMRTYLNQWRTAHTHNFFSQKERIKSFNFWIKLIGHGSWPIHLSPQQSRKILLVSCLEALSLLAGSILLFSMVKASTIHSSYVIRLLTRVAYAVISIGII